MIHKCPNGNHDLDFYEILPYGKEKYQCTRCNKFFIFEGEKMNRENFVNSYYNTIKNMDLRVVKPYSETEIQPLYSSQWIQDSILMIKKLEEHTTFNPNLFLNQSVIRSMLVMDIFDLYFSKSSKDKIRTIVDFYDGALDYFYSDNKYSERGDNVPNSSKFYKYNDCSYFMSNNKKIDSLIGQLFRYCYSKWGDMFADNSYEVTGVHQIKNYKVINNTFYIEGDRYNVLQYFNKNEIGSIDMFGHSIMNNCVGKVVLKNNNIIENIDILLDEIMYINQRTSINKNESANEDKLWMLDSRLARYEHIEWISGTVFNRKDYLKLLLNRQVEKKIVDKEELKEIINTVLIRGGY